MLKIEEDIQGLYYERCLVEAELRSKEYKLERQGGRWTAQLAKRGFTPEATAALKADYKLLTDEMSDLAVLHPIWNWWMADVKGIGPNLAASLIGTWGDLDKITTVSQLWASAALGVVCSCGCKKQDHGWGYDSANERCLIHPETCEEYNPVAERRRKAGQAVAGYGPFCRVCWIMRDCLLKARGVYFEWKEEEQARQMAAGLEEGHARRRGMRHMSKLFLAHAFQARQESLGHPFEKPYAFAFLFRDGVDAEGHEHHYIEPLRDKVPRRSTGLARWGSVSSQGAYPFNE